MRADGKGRPPRGPAGQCRLLLIVGALLLAACSDGGEPDAGPDGTESDRALATAEPTDLWGAQHTVLGDDLWVFGGLVAEEGTSPPVTSEVPQGWSPNRTVVAYSSDGEVTQRHQLPPLEHGLIFGSVLGDDDRYLLGTMCDGAGGCGGWVEPVLYRLDGNDSEEVPLQLPPLQPSDDAGVGLIYPLGATDSTAWALQYVTATGSGYAGLADQYRLLGIDLATGQAFDGDLPSGVYGSQLVCAVDGVVFAARADVADGGILHRVDILARRDASPTAEWEPVVEMPMDPQEVWTGSLHCLEGLDEIVLALGGNPAQVHTFDLRTGEATQPVSALEGLFGPLLGSVDGAAVAMGEDGEQRWFWSHQAGGPWRRGPALEPGSPQELIVLDGALFDASAVLETLAPSASVLPKVELPAPEG